MTDLLKIDKPAAKSRLTAIRQIRNLINEISNIEFDNDGEVRDLVYENQVNFESDIENLENLMAKIQGLKIGT